jgi:hypothetical protein
MLRSKESVLAIQFANVSSKMSSRIRATEGPRQYLGMGAAFGNYAMKKVMKLLTHKDRASLKPGPHLPLTDWRRPIFPRTISKELRARVLERDGLTCQACGAGPDDPDPFRPGHKIQLTIGHIIDLSKAEKRN